MVDGIFSKELPEHYLKFEKYVRNLCGCQWDLWRLTAKEGAGVLWDEISFTVCMDNAITSAPVSYTHLTLPTICSV